MGMNCVEHPLDMGMFYQLKVSFNMGIFQILDTHIRVFHIGVAPSGKKTLAVGTA